MKRRLFTMAVFLLLGAIINVAMAWGFAVAAHPPFGHARFYLASPWPEILQDGAVCCEPDHLVGAESLGASSLFSYVIVENLEKAVHMDGTKPNEWSLPMWVRPDEFREIHHPTVLIAYGWPARSMAMKAQQRDTAFVRNEWDLESGLQLSMRMTGPTSGQMPRAIPLRLTWPGFALNSIFYGAILWLVFFTPDAIRRTIRRRRKQCPACGYPTGVSPVCTECGAAVRSEQSAR